MSEYKYSDLMIGISRAGGTSQRKKELADSKESQLASHSSHMNNGTDELNSRFTQKKS